MTTAIYVYIYIVYILAFVKCRSIYYKLKDILKGTISKLYFDSLFIYKSQNIRIKLEEVECLNIVLKITFKLP